MEILRKDSKERIIALRSKLFTFGITSYYSPFGLLLRKQYYNKQLFDNLRYDTYLDAHYLITHCKIDIDKLESYVFFGGNLGNQDQTEQNSVI